MRLINAHTLRLEEFSSEIPDYAILSHTWGVDEVTLQDWADLGKARKKAAGYAKIEGSCRQAVSEGIDYVWVDTNCIDKTSSAELSEAINSMFAWYRDSKVCYVYLSDVSVSELELSSGPDDSTAYVAIPKVSAPFRESRWFTRGWTLQELLAPSELVFYSREWRPLGTKNSKAGRALISEITGIDSDYLRQPKKIQHASVARRMSWMASRTTTRVEDVAYCMLGIFDINMALLYGEGEKAFLRLQEEIIKVSNDQTIFCWQAKPREDDKIPKDWVSILAPNPAVFADSGQYFPGSGDNASAVSPYSITNYGLSIHVPLFYTAMGACAILDVGIRGRRDQDSRVIVPLHRVPGARDGHYVRLSTDLLVSAVPDQLLKARTQIYVECRNARAKGIEGLLTTRMSSPRVGLNTCYGKVLLLAFNVPVNVDKNPVASTGMEFHALHSAVELSHDMATGRGGVLLQGKVGPSADFHLFVAGRSGPKNSMGWHLDTWRFRPGAVARRNSAPVDTGYLGAFLHRLEEEFFGEWCFSECLRSVASWSSSEEGAIICFLELNEAKADYPQQAVRPDSPRFDYLRRSNSSTSSLERLFQGVESSSPTEDKPAVVENPERQPERPPERQPVTVTVSKKSRPNVKVASLQEERV